MPLKTVKLAGKLMRGVPRLTADPDERMIVKAEGLLAFVDKTRSSAPAGGYASLRSKVVEKLNARLDEYAEDLIEELRKEETRSTPGPASSSNSAPASSASSATRRPPRSCVAGLQLRRLAKAAVIG